ncbi:MAG TPA: hypothetical protein VNH53_10030 [Sphingomicrobium sp.]|jgi:hypothetical protein|nr:hypothetical protein [Sphingomicrobium sp.]
MTDKARSPSGLQVQEDRAWQEKFWSAQRVGWVVMALLVLAALAGATGKGGPVASASARTPAGIIEYPRIARLQSDEKVTVRLPPSASGEIPVELLRPFAESFSIELIEPEPSHVEATADGQRFIFNVGSCGGGEKLIVFHVRARRAAMNSRLAVRIGDERPVTLAVTVLP